MRHTPMWVVSSGLANAVNLYVYSHDLSLPRVFCGLLYVDELDKVKVHDSCFFFFVLRCQEVETIFAVEVNGFRIVIRIDDDKSTTSLIPLSEPNLQEIHDPRTDAGPSHVRLDAEAANLYRWHARISFSLWNQLLDPFKSAARTFLALDGVIGYAEKRECVAILVPDVRNGYQLGCAKL